MFKHLLKSGFCVVLIFAASHDLAAAQLTATWTGSGDGISYNDPANWDIGVVPINGGGDTYIVVIPNSQSVNFNVPGAGNQVDEVSLGAGATLNMTPPNLALETLGAATIAGNVQADTGSFTASSTTSMFTGPARLTAINGGDISIAATSLNATYSNSQTILLADGTGSTIDLSDVLSLVVNDNTTGTDTMTVRAANSGIIDLSAATSATSDNILKFEIESGGDVVLDSLQSVSRVVFDVDVTAYSLPALVSAELSTFDVATGSTLLLPSLTTLTGSTVTIAGGGGFNAPNLADFRSSTVTLTPDTTFTTAPLVNVDSSRFFVHAGRVFDSVSATTINSTYSNSQTILESDGTGSLLDLSSVTSLVVDDNTTGTDTLTVRASNNGVIDLSSVISASSNNILRFAIESGGNIDLDNLQSTSRVTFDIDGGSYTLPALATAANTTFDAGENTTITLPSLTSHDGGGHTVGMDGVINALALTTLQNATVTLAQNAVLNAPNLDDFAGSTVTLGIGTTFIAGPLVNVDGSRFYVEAGTTFDAVSATSMTGTYSNSQTILSANGAASLLDLSTLLSLVADDNTTGTDTLTVQASNDGVIDLSSVTTASSNNILRFAVSSGGDIRLDGLQLVTGVTFDIDVAAYSLPSLQTADRTTFDVATGTTLNLPSLGVITSSTVTIAGDGEFVAPSLIDFRSSTVSLTSDTTFTTGALANIDGSRFFVRAGAVFDSVVATAMNSTYSNSQTILEADGAGSVLDLSSLISLVANDNSTGLDSLTVQAINGGIVDLTSVTSASSNDIVRFAVASGGDIGLDSLQSATGASFDVDISAYSLPALDTANRTTFDVATGSTLDLPMLSTLTGSSVVIASGGEFNAPNLIDFRTSIVTLTPDTSFTTGSLANIDGSRFFVNDGAVFNAVSATSMSGTYSNSQTVLEADGAGSLLDLSSLESLVANDNSTGTDTLTVSTKNGGAIDLSSVVSASSNDILRFSAESGGQLDLGSLQTATRVRFEANSGGTIAVGSLEAASTVAISASDLDSAIAFSGDVNLGPGSTAALSGGAELKLGGDFSFTMTTESDIQLDSAILRLDGTGGQRFEVGGEDLGLPGPANGNFGIGQLIIGQTTQRTSADLLDVVDNGNRGVGGEAEALYLFGLGGPDGLRILNDSALILNGINVYAWDAAMAQMVHLNSLFQPGDLRLDFDDGYLQLVPLDFQWDNPLGGDFNLPTNWSDDLLPLASDSALWNLASLGGYTVQFGTNVATDSALVLSDGVTFDLGGFTYSTAGLHATESIVVGLSETDNGRLTVTNGTLTGSNGRVAAAGGATGLLTIGGTGKLELSGDLTLGDGDATLRVESGGTARVVQTLIVRETGVVDLLPGGTVTVGSGPIETTASTLRVHADGTLLAGGAVQGNVVSAGQVQIGASPGTLQVTGDFAQEASGSLEIEIDGALPGDEFDLLAVDGSATLDGHLDLLLDEAFSPTLAQEIAFLTADLGVSGTFATVNGVEALADLSLAVLYEANRVVIRGTIPGDFDADDDVDGDDFLTWQSNFGATAGATWQTADADGDGDVDGDDFLTWQSNFGSTGGFASTAVPEPAAFLLLLIAVSCLATSHFRSRMT